MDDRYQIAKTSEKLQFGTYFEAEDTLIQRKVQVFRFPVPESVDESEWKETFESCSSEIATISHPGLPIVYHHGIDEEGPYSIRQLFETTGLNAHLVDIGPFNEYEGWELAQQMLDIHDAARKTNNFHGAIDPNHIGYTARPSGEKRYSITDYGLAEIHNRMHNTSAYFGSSFFISPEQSRGEEHTEQSQVYSIGQLVFHALSGGHPWLETPLETIIEQLPESNLGLITEYNPNVPEAMVQWLEKMIAFDPEVRFKSYAEALENLPGPLHAPAPLDRTGAVLQIPATYVSPATQAITQVVTQSVSITSAVETFAAQQAVQEAVKKEERTALLKNPLVLGGAAAVLLLAIVGIVNVSGVDEDSTTSTSSVQTSQNKSAIPQEGLVAYLNFDESEASASNNASLQLEPLKLSAKYSRKGLKGKAIILDKKHYYRLPLANTPIVQSSSDYTVSFWVRPSTSQDSSLAMHSQQPWDSKNSEVVTGVDPQYKWNVNDAQVYGNYWNMVTMVCSKSSESITVYIDAKLVGKSSSAEISETLKEPYVYLGCDKNMKLLNDSEVLVDEFYIWNRTLNSDEIEQVFRD